MALSGYAAGLVGFAAHRVLNPAFFALSDARTPMLVSLSSIAVNILFPLLLLRVWHIGFLALALTSALAVVMESLPAGGMFAAQTGRIGRALFAE